MKWIAGCPAEDEKGQFFCTCLRNDNVRYVASDALFAPQAQMMGNVIAYSPVEHFLDNREGWMSEYMGDEPKANTLYFCCLENDKKIRCLWYSGNNINMLAFRNFPQPYKGKLKGCL